MWYTKNKFIGGIEMNRQEFEQYLYEEFPSVFENSFSREMLSNILDYAETIGDENEQYLFLGNMIPQVSERELRSVFL